MKFCIDFNARAKPWSTSISLILIFLGVPLQSTEGQVWANDEKWRFSWLEAVSSRQMDVSEAFSLCWRTLWIGQWLTELFCCPLSAEARRSFYINPTEGMSAGYTVLKSCVFWFPVSRKRGRLEPWSPHMRLWQSHVVNRCKWMFFSTNVYSPQKKMHMVFAAGK